MNGKNCVSSETPVCPDGTRFNGKACVSTAEKPFCADAASVFSNNTCVISKDPRCPELSTLNKGEYVSSTLHVCQMERLSAEITVLPIPSPSARTASLSRIEFAFPLLRHHAPAIAPW
ncbi:hypothetical protein V8C34DRAFT_31176 [Trichoderma compactum]